MSPQISLMAFIPQSFFTYLSGSASYVVTGRSPSKTQLSLLGSKLTIYLNIYPLLKPSYTPCLNSVKQIKTTGAFVRVAYYFVCRRGRSRKLQFVFHPCVMEYGFTFELSFCLVFSIESLFQYSGCFFLVK